MKNSTWSGRFKKGLDEEVLEFSESISIDHLLFDCDIRVCIAHAEMLSECKIISIKESKLLIKGLKKVKDKYDNGKLSLSIKYEDSFKRDLELFVPLITTIILLLSLFADPAIPQPDFFVYPVFKPSEPTICVNSLFLFGWLISL